ncbi:3'-5' exonuclease [Streptomyces specialis]|uniref:3'-5' exonuclease n=1 Tax=Streptomyces specialis TaxID=498367 RepID=UPI00073E9505|nr:3'-5' exonuclease [Streptomyces specialis]
MTDWKTLNYVVVDVEGNGQQPPELVELAAVPIVGGVIGEPVSWLVRPQRRITSFARGVHGISNDAVADAPTFTAITDEVRQALEHPALIAHNAPVDVSVLRRELGEWECPEVFDTLRLARRFLPQQDSHRLGSLVEAFTLADGLSPDLRPHRAAYDALVTARLFVLLAGTSDVPRSLEELRDQPAEGKADEAATLF